MKRRLATLALLVCALVGISSAAWACPPGSQRVAKGPPGFPDICAQRIQGTGLFYIFPW